MNRYTLRKVSTNDSFQSPHQVNSIILKKGCTEKEIRKALLNEGILKSHHLTELYKFWFIKKIASDNGYFILKEE